METPQLVLVVWRDPSFGFDEEQPLSLMLTLGFVIDDSGGTLLIASEFDSTQNDYRQHTRIPRTLVAGIIPVEIDHAKLKEIQNDREDPLSD